jgi:predicted lipid-binding transport protein (Tim44 family)
MTPAQPSGADSALPPALAPDALSSMFQSIAGLRNLRAAAAMLGCFVAGVLVAGLLGYLGRGSFVVTGLAGLLAALLFFTGIHAAGVLLMDQARRLPPRSVMDAVVYGLMCVPKTIALIVLMVLAVIALYVVMWLLFLVCKIPGLGPVLFTFVFPACVLLAGLTTVGILIALQMALPALWEGAGVMAALAKAFAILKSRLVETVMLLAVVAVLSGFVFAFVGAVLMFGFFPAMGLAATSIGSLGGSMGGAGMHGGGDMFGSMMGGLMRGGMGGYAIAGGLGSGLLWAVAMTLVFQVSLLGANLAYLRVSEGIDSSATERAMHDRLEQAKRKAAEMGQQAKEAAERARAQAAQAAEQRRAAAAAAQPPAAAPPVVAPSPPPAAPAMASTCPQCRAAVGAQDQFCGECGFRLR